MTIAALALAILLLIALALLYISTERSWDWRIIIICTAGIIVFALVGFFSYDQLFNRTSAQTGYWELTLGESKSDVKFKKGEPSEKLSEQSWLYLDRDRNHRIGFDANNQIESIVVIPNREYMYIKPILGIDSSTTPDDLVKRLGEPEKIESSADLLTRTYRYDALQLVVVFAKQRVIELGIYTP